MSAKEDLMRLVPPPRHATHAPDWGQVEAKVGMGLPSDYKWLVERYGEGSFDDFIYVFQPASAIDGIRLEHQAEQTTFALNYLREGGEAVPYSNSELLSFARTENGDFCYWLRHPSGDPDAWTIVVNEARGPRWSSFDGGVVKFLYQILSGSQRITVFPDDFPSGDPEFAPLG